MPVMISLLRAVNVGGHHKVKMDALRALYESLGLRDACTYVQSGNVIFTTKERDPARVARRIEDGIEKAFGFRCDVMVRTSAELREVIRRNPFVSRPGIEPGKLLTFFLSIDPASEGLEKLRTFKADPEELQIDGRELYIYFPIGMGKSKLPLASILKMLKTSGTGRNLTSVKKMLEIAEKLEATERSADGG